MGHEPRDEDDASGTLFLREVVVQAKPPLRPRLDPPGGNDTTFSYRQK